MSIFDPYSRRWLAYWLRRVFLWFGSDRPRRMWAGGRTQDVHFSPKELLYLRCFEWSVEGDRLADVGAIGFPDQSVNREKFSRPGDALIPEPGNEKSCRWIYLGVVAFPVCAVPRTLEDKGEAICDCTVEHDPLDHNYAHSELRAYKGGKRITDKRDVPKIRRKQYRHRIMELARVVVRPLE